MSRSMADSIVREGLQKVFEKNKGERKVYGSSRSFASSKLQVRTFNGIDLNALEFEPSHGVEEVEPAGDLSGIWYDLEEKERAEQIKKEQDEKELAAAAVTA